MMRRLLPLLAVPILTAALAAQQTQAPPAAAPQEPQRGRGGRAQQTPEQREAAARAAHERAAALPRPIPARDSVWIDELTYLEVRDAIKAGKTTALVFAGSTEQNGPYMSGGKHQYAIRLVGESLARKLGNALIAPVIPIEAGNPDNRYLEWGSFYLTPDTFQAVVRDIATSLKSQGFQNIVLLGDSGGDTAGLRAVAQDLSARWGGAPRVVHVPEYYNWTSAGGVRDFVKQNGIAENATADGIHDEYGLTAVMMASDPKIVRYDERVAAKKATINGIDIAPKDRTIEMGKKIVEFRATVGAEAIRKALAAPAPAAAAPAAASTANPRFGRWKLKSDNPNSTNIMTYEPHNGTGMKITVETTNAAGEKSAWGYTTMFDGRAYPVTGRRGTDGAIVRIVTDRINEIVYKQGDRVTQLLVNVLSADNNTIEVTYYSTSAEGQTRVTNATYERVQ
jgi:creatinine amidohydrolase/Fe(II)-dependent formamide hydrolase-like protein